MRWSLRRQTPQIEDIRDWQDSIEPTVQQQNEETVRCKSTRKLALTLYSDKANQSVQTRIYIRRTRPTNPYKQDIYTLSSVQTSLLRVNRSNMIYRVTSYSKKKKRKNNSSRDLKGRETRKQGPQPQQVSCRLIICLSFRLRQITDLLAADKSRYFA